VASHNISILQPCLPLPQAYFEITQIADALALHRTLQEKRGAAASADGTVAAEEEIEDGDGNIYSRKLFEELQRQGLVK
jgi:splicing factor 3A subunit 3